VLILLALGAVQVSKARPVKTFTDAGWEGPATVAGVAPPVEEEAADFGAPWPGADAFALADDVAVPEADAEARAEGLVDPVGRAVPDAVAAGEAPAWSAPVPASPGAAALPPFPPPPPDPAPAATAAPAPITATAAAIAA
jgi:hypothetical protein